MLQIPFVQVSEVNNLPEWGCGASVHRGPSVVTLTTPRPPVTTTPPQTPRPTPRLTPQPQLPWWQQATTTTPAPFRPWWQQQATTTTPPPFRPWIFWTPPPRVTARPQHEVLTMAPTPEILTRIPWSVFPTQAPPQSQILTRPPPEVLTRPSPQEILTRPPPVFITRSPVSEILTRPPPMTDNPRFQLPTPRPTLAPTPGPNTRPPVPMSFIPIPSNVLLAQEALSSLHESGLAPQGKDADSNNPDPGSSNSNTNTGAGVNTETPGSESQLPAAQAPVLIHFTRHAIRPTENTTTHTVINNGVVIGSGSSGQSGVFNPGSPQPQPTTTTTTILTTTTTPQLQAHPGGSLSQFLLPPLLFPQSSGWGSEVKDVCEQGVTCQLPSCQCRSLHPPASLGIRVTPQIIYLTITGV
jgi:hypothetical protein